MSPEAAGPILGLLPPSGGGLTPLAASGQASRLVHDYFTAYLGDFRHLYYFSYYLESLSDFSDDRTILDRTSLLPKRSPLPYQAYAFYMPFEARPQMRECSVLRVFQATGAWPAIVARLLYDVPYVVTYGYRYHHIARVDGRRLRSIYLRILEPLALRQAAAVIVTTQELADYVTKLVPAQKVQLIPNGVDTSLFSPSGRDSTISRRPKTILFVGRFARQKNLTRLLEAVAVLGKSLSVELRMVGEGEMKRELEESAARLGLTCRFEGVVPHERLPAIMNAADVFVLPSLVEGHPKALLEAMSCGVACVVSHCEGNRALVQHGRTGLLFDPLDVASISSQIERALRDPSLAHVLGNAARKTVIAGYELRQLIGREVGLLRSIAKGYRS